MRRFLWISSVRLLCDARKNETIHRMISCESLTKYSFSLRIHYKREKHVETNITAAPQKQITYQTMKRDCSLFKFQSYATFVLLFVAFVLQKKWNEMKWNERHFFKEWRKSWKKRPFMDNISLTQNTTLL
jgi:hypothetical protein